MNHKPYFANRPKQFPQPRQPQSQPQQKVNTNFDLENQLLCPCGSELFEPAMTVFRVPGQLVGTVDITFNQVLMCIECGRLLNMQESKTRKESGTNPELPKGA